jgi:putative ABC transport system ATP-binding protein
MIELQRLSRTFVEGDRRHVVLDEVSLRVAEGEFVILLGRSGSGKSTLLNLLCGIDLPTGGEVIVDGVSLGDLDERRRTLFRRDRVGFVFQFFHLVPTLTALENLLLPLELKHGRIGDSEREKAEQMLDRVGLGDRADSFPDRLSGGERQRVAIARALIHDPAIVLPDEPTGNLDLDTGLEVLDLLDRLTRRAGKTMIMATHSREVVGMADRIVSIEHGRLVERGGGTR